MTYGKRAAYDRGKRLVDVLVAALGLVLTAPIQLGIAALVRRRLGAPVLFRQQRPGRYGQPFIIYKFRTMIDADKRLDAASDAERLTTFGAWLRSTSLDELPTLWNVLKGDMSLVGPRPLLVVYLDRYSAEQSRRHEVRPGITGLAQVAGRNRLTWSAKFQADIDYVTRRSFALDLRIIARTVSSVLGRDGITAQGEATMTEFMGDGVTVPP